MAARNRRRNASRYDAFVSYSHLADGTLGPALRDALHEFARPWNRTRALRVFCDRSSLQSSPDLWDSIARALDTSEFLILLASPSAAAAPWVGREIERWRAAPRPRPVLLVQTAGSIVWDETRRDFDWSRTDAVPLALSGWFPAEPQWVVLDGAATGSRPQSSMRDPAFLDVVASLAAALHDRPKDELIGADVDKFRVAQRFRRWMWSTLSVLLVLVSVVALIAVTQGTIAARERDNAVFSQLTAQVDRFAETDATLAPVSWIVRS